MKIAKDAFKNLRIEWYQKLAATGFSDAELLIGNQMVLKQKADYPYRKDDEFSRQMKEEYYRIIGQNSQDPDIPFKNETERFILIRHGEGTEINTICRELGRRSITFTKETVRVIIRRYEMAWQLRAYSRKQLRMKKRKHERI